MGGMLPAYNKRIWNWWERMIVRLGVAVLVAYLVGCSASQHPPDEPRAECAIGFPSRVVTECGCHPTQQSLISRIRTTGWNESIRRRVRECSSRSVTSSETNPEVVENCVTQSVSLDETMREELLELVRSAYSDTDSETIRTWRRCYNCQLNGRDCPVRPPSDDDGPPPSRSGGGGGGGVVASFCMTNVGSCPMMVPIPSGSVCYCASPMGPIPGFAR